MRKQLEFWDRKARKPAIWPKLTIQQRAEVINLLSGLLAQTLDPADPSPPSIQEKTHEPS